MFSVPRSVVRRQRLGFIGLVLLGFAPACGPSDTDASPDGASAVSSPVPVKVYRQSVQAMGTVFSCTLPLKNGDTRGAADAVRAAFEEVSRVEGVMSSFVANSAVSAVNGAAGERPVKVPRELLDLIAESLSVSKRTEGKFDISFRPLGRVWHFKDPEPSVPSPAVIEAAKRLVDYRKIVVDRQAGTVFLKDKGMSIGLGAIAKGYGVDRAAAVLIGKGYSDFIVYGGGDIYMAGRKGDAPWRVGIQDPRNRTVYFADFDLWKNAAVVTSGDYEKYFFADAKRYHHILDPADGYPARGVVSVTILAKSTALADALATGVFGLGLEKGMALIESDPDLEGILVDDKLVPHLSSGLKSRVSVRPISGAEEVLP